MRTLPVSSPRKYGPQLLPAKGRVLVTGGAGYLGSALVRRLLASDYQVRVLDALLYGAEPLAALQRHPRFELVKGDIRDLAVLEKSLKGCATVVHLAAIVGDGACQRHSELARSVNTVATHRLLQSCRRQDVHRFIFASTCSVYGCSPDMVDESSAPSPISLYAETKAAAERLVLDAASRHFHSTVFRLPTLFGMSPRPRFDLVINLLTARAACEGRIRVLNGGQWRPFAHVADVARAFEMCMEADISAVSGQVLNVGDERMNLQLFELSRAIQRLVPAVQVVCEENNDPRSYRPSFQKILRSLGFGCERSLQEGIAEVHNSLRTGRIRNFSDARYSNDLALDRYIAGISVRSTEVVKVPAQRKARLAASRAVAAAC